MVEIDKKADMIVPKKGFCKEYDEGLISLGRYYKIIMEEEKKWKRYYGDNDEVILIQNLRIKN